MIVTLTPNPSVDRTISFERIELGEVQRATASRVDPGGKGVNISRALVANGSSTLAVLPVGGPEGRLLTDLLDRAGVSHRDVAIEGSARMNIAAVTPDGTTTKLNESGPALSPQDVEDLLATTVAAAAGAQWVVGCGSLPPGVPTTFYAELVRRVRAAGARVAIDSSGASFADAVAVQPSLIKPNHEELAELVGRPLPAMGDVVAAARDLVRAGIETVVVSLGADGAIAVDRTQLDGAWLWAGATVARPVSTVGAGDCLLAGLLDGLAAGRSLADSLAAGVAWGAAAVALPGSDVPTPEAVAAVSVRAAERPDPTTRISASGSRSPERT
ncbi:1-phosphofructokinase [Calidifontibacter terrae]